MLKSPLAWTRGQEMHNQKVNFSKVYINSRLNNLTSSSLFFFRLSLLMQPIWKFQRRHGKRRCTSRRYALPDIHIMNSTWKNPKVLIQYYLSLSRIQMIYSDKTKEPEMCQIDPFKKECVWAPPPPKKIEKKNPYRNKYNSNDISCAFACKWFSIALAFLFLTGSHGQIIQHCICVFVFGCVPWHCSRPSKNTKTHIPIHSRVIQHYSHL